MNGLGTRLRRLFKEPTVSTDELRLPPEILGALTQKDAPRVQQWLNQSLQSRKTIPDLAPVVEAAQRAGWSAIDLTKLETFTYYYHGDSAKALNRAKAYIDTVDFDPDLFIVAILSLHQLGLFEEAYQRLSDLGDREEFFDGRSDFALSAALICWAANDAQETRRHISNARRLAPDDTVIALNANAMYFELGDLADFAQVRAALQGGQHDLDKTGYSLAVVELAQDHYEDGFRLLESRYQMQDAHRYLNRGLFDRPRWTGETLCGKTLLISAEQGLGDTIQMARFLPQMETLGCARVLMESQPETVTLLQFNFPQFEFLVREYDQAPTRTFDLWTGLMSLPHLFRTTADTVPDRSGYLRVPPDNTHYWCGRVAQLARPGKPRIGLAWSGFPTHRADRRRSIPFNRMMEAIRGLDADFFSLQISVPPSHPANLIDVSEELVTIADTAALIAEMDLIITVDTSIVHLAGAIGHPTWLLLPYRYEWRWGLDGETNRWYDSVRILRSRVSGDWTNLLVEVFESRLPDWLSWQRSS